MASMSVNSSKACNLVDYKTTDGRPTEHCNSTKPNLPISKDEILGSANACSVNKRPCHT